MRQGHATPTQCARLLDVDVEPRLCSQPSPPPRTRDSPPNSREERSPNDPPLPRPPRGKYARNLNPTFHYYSIVARGKFFFGAVDLWGK